MSIHETKKASTAYPLLPAIADRWSPRAFADREVEKEKLLTVLEAARWAASSSNQQPWRFIVARRDEESFTQMLSCLKEGNLSWARHAPVLILAFAKVILEAKGDRPERRNGHAWHDVGQAVATMSIQARALDLFVHQMGGYYPEKARETFALPEAYEPVSMIALGYLGEADGLEERHRESEHKPRQRQDLSDFVFSNRYGEPSTLLTHDENQ